MEGRGADSGVHRSEGIAACSTVSCPRGGNRGAERSRRLEALFEEALARSEKKYGAQSAETARSGSDLGLFLKTLKRFFLRGGAVDTSHGDRSDQRQRNGSGRLGEPGGDASGGRKKTRGIRSVPRGCARRGFRDRRAMPRPTGSARFRECRSILSACAAAGGEGGWQRRSADSHRAEQSGAGIAPEE